MKWVIIIFLLTFLIPIVYAGLEIGLDNPEIPRIVLETPTTTTSGSGTDTNVTTACIGGTVLLGNGTCAAYSSGGAAGP